MGKAKYLAVVLRIGLWMLPVSPTLYSLPTQQDSLNNLWDGEK